LIATPTIRSGHSIDLEVHKVFAFLFINVLTHEDEVQFLHRARKSPKKETTEMYIQAGVSGRCNTSYEKQVLTCASLYDNDQMVSATADVLAEKADSRNRHYWLFRLEAQWKMVCVDDSTKRNTDYMTVTSHYKKTQEPYDGMLLSLLKLETSNPDRHSRIVQQQEATTMKDVFGGSQ
jgi:intracellular sulfur oxidation DsrE/DsrF family protein